MPTFTTRRAGWRGALFTAASILSLGFAGQAAASTTIQVVDAINRVPNPTKTFDAQKDQKVSGSVSQDAGQAKGPADATYSATASFGSLAISTRSNSVSASSTNDVGVNVQAIYTDEAMLSGKNAGQKLIFHKNLSISGDNSFTEGPLGTNSVVNGQVDMRITGSGVPEGPYFPNQGMPDYATANYTDATDGEIVRPPRVLNAPTSVDLAFGMIVGQENFIDFDLTLDTYLATDGSAEGTLNANYQINWDTGPGYFTLTDKFGRDTGVRVDPNAGLSLIGLNFNYLAAAGEGAVPEPASWAMLIAGFGMVGASLRRRHAAVA